MTVGNVVDTDPQSWTEALPSIFHARELIMNRAGLNVDEPSLSIDGLVVLGWVKTGIKKVSCNKFGL